MQIKTKKHIFYFRGPDKGLTLFLRISIRDGKSGLSSSLFENVCLRCLIFFILKSLHFLYFVKI